MGSPTSQGSVFILGRGDSIFINPFLLRAELSPDIVAISECTKRTESGMRTFFHITSPQNQEEKSDTHEPKVLFLDTFGETGLFRAIQYKETIRVGGTSRRSRRPRDVDLHQKFSYIRVGSCGHLLGFFTWCGSVSPGIGQRPSEASYSNWGVPWKAESVWRHLSGTRDSLEIHPEYSGNGPEEVRRGHSRHPENSGL